MDIQYGVGRLSIISVRKEPSSLSQQVTQLLFGDHYEVIDESKDRHWLQIRIYFDGTIGWIDAKQHHAITREYFDQINTADFKITTDVCSTILYKKTPLSIVIGSVVPISQSELFKMEEQFAFNGEAKSIGQKRDGEFVKNIALKYLNAPEQDGGRSPFGIDGMGLIQTVYRIAGYHLPRSLALFQSQHQQVSLPQVLLKAGQGLSVALLVADDKIMHVSGRARIDLLAGNEVIDAETKIKTHAINNVLHVLVD
jgi:hypothetical protein